MTKLVAFDYETTSPEPSSTRGVQLAAMVVEIPDGLDLECNRAALRHEMLMNEITNPEVDIHHEAAEVHGITPEMVMDKRPDYLASQELYDYLAAYRDDIVLLTHNGTTFDVPILERLAQMNSSKPRPRLQLPHIDTLTCSTRLWPNAPNHKLSLTKEEANKLALKDKDGKHPGLGLTQWLGLGTGEGAHDALVDIGMVVNLVCHIRQKFKNNTMTFRDLAEWCAAPRVLTVAHFGKFKGKPWGKGPGCVPVGYVRFICEKFKDTTPDMIATIRHHYGLTFDYITRSKRNA